MNMTTTSFPIPAPPPQKRRAPIVRVMVALLILVFFALPVVWWYLTPPRQVGVVVINKTLPHPAWREHERVHWWLDHRRVADPRGAVRWNTTADYVGYDPVRKQGTDLDSTMLRGAKLVYIADAYGVYTGDYEDHRDSANVAALEPSRLIYGGMQAQEVDALEALIARGGNVVAEFNTLEDPTAGTEPGERLGRLLGVSFNRWIGRWYRDLASADEIPTWLRERYERVYWKPWAFSGPGIVVFSGVDDRVVVVEGKEFTAQWPVTLDVDDASDPLTAEVRTGQPYWYWFSSVTPTDSGATLAHFTLHVNGAAKTRLETMGFATSLPAIVRHRGSGVRAYLTGDFADVGVEPEPLRRTRGMDWFGRLQARSGEPGMQQRFFWNVTMPIWDGMLDEVRRQGQ